MTPLPNSTQLTERGMMMDWGTVAAVVVGMSIVLGSLFLTAALMMGLVARSIKKKIAAAGDTGMPPCAAMMGKKPPHPESQTRAA